MHERSLARALVRTALEAAAGARVLEVRARVGALCHVNSESLGGWFAAEAQGTPLEGARLVLDRCPARAHCGACGWEGPTTFPLPLACPACAGQALRFSGGDELLVESLEVVDP